MKFAFLVHPLSEETSRLLDFLTGDRTRALSDSWGHDLLAFCAQFHEAVRHRPLSEESDADGLLPTVRVVDALPGLLSNQGSSTEGRLYEIPMYPAQILDEPTRAIDYMVQAVEMAADWGARIVGLGSMTGIVGGQGAYLAQHSPVAVTTGNHLTVYAALENLYQGCREAEIDLARQTVAVIGVPGSIASAAARLLASRCRSLILVARRPSARASELADELGAELALRIPPVLRRARVVFSATSSGDCIEQPWLPPGNLVLDVGVPTDVCGSEASRPDVLVLSGGLARVPETMPLESIYLRFHQGMVPSCLAETMVLALEQRAECFSLGRRLDPARIEEIGRLAKAHGFGFTRLFSFGLPLEESALVRFRKSVRRGGGRTLGGGTGAGRAGAASGADDGTPAPLPQENPHPLSPEAARRAALLAARHLNPVLIALGSTSGLVKTFVRGQGADLWDAEGNRYLDFVAGFGAVNLGHNHPAVVQAVEEALRRRAPGFCPAAVNPFAAALAEQLATLAPGDLEMVFFANSGAEAVEAALKLARAATGRAGLLSCEGSFHGKTLGALSVTGKAHFRKPFEPLVPKCRSIPYGDLEALERALSGRRFAAFVVEPLQAEGGMIVPPAGYLREAQRLCRKTATLLVVDEVQTGLGRTGAMFAVEHEGVEPDLMTLAKSLSGGLVPIGAMLARRDLWMRAYGTVQASALHSSTFGGGSLACAAGLATLEVLRREDLAANAAARGGQLLTGLNALAGRCDLFADVRGKGLLVGIEFKPAPATLIRLWKEVGSAKLNPYLVPDFDAFLRNGPSLYVMQSLLQEHRVHAQLARSNPLVLRVQPPLTISAEQVEYFLAAVGQCCRVLDASYKMFTGVTAKSGLGQHQARPSRSGAATKR